MSLSAFELKQITQELSQGLAGAVVQKLWLARPGLCQLELRSVGASTLLSLSVEPGVSRMSVTANRVPAPPTPLGAQALLRRELLGARWLLAQSRGLLAGIELERAGEHKSLVLDLTGRAGHLLFIDASGRLRAVTPSAGSSTVSSGVRLGEVFAWPPAAETRDDGMRLVIEPGARFPFAEAADKLFCGTERALAAHQARRAVLGPLKKRLARIDRTLKKVEEEASRQALALEHKRTAELLARNSSQLRISKGAREVTLTEYTASGAQDVTVTLHPARSPKQEAEWRFHQYRRLSKGVLIAQERQRQLLGERQEVFERLLELERQSDEALLVQLPSAPTVRAAKHPEARRPFREYRGRGGGSIWVGKGAKENEELTLRWAKPHHLWLHARGVPGAHVVVPMEKGKAVSQQTLVEAAHLAVHHSDAKGEPKAEVSYTQVKFVRKAKGGALGQVTYTQEKTFLLRVDLILLGELLASASD